jgi:hypothetical protein
VTTFDIFAVKVDGTLIAYRYAAPIPDDEGDPPVDPTGGLGVQPLGTSPLGGS